MNSLKSPVTPLFLIFAAIYILVKATLDLCEYLAPYLYEGLVLLGNATKALLKAAFLALVAWGYEVSNYFYPTEERDTFSGTLDTLLGILLSDIGRAIAYLGKAGTRICE